MGAGSFLCRTVVFSYQEEFRALARNPHPWYSGDVSTLDLHANLAQRKLTSPNQVHSLGPVQSRQGICDSYQQTEQGSR